MYRTNFCDVQLFKKINEGQIELHIKEDRPKAAPVPYKTPCYEDVEQLEVQLHYS